MLSVEYVTMVTCKHSHFSVPAQSLDLKDPLEGVAAQASPDPEPLPPNIYADIPQLDNGQKSQVFTMLLIIVC